MDTPSRKSAYVAIRFRNLLLCALCLGFSPLAAADADGEETLTVALEHGTAQEVLALLAPFGPVPQQVLPTGVTLITQGPTEKSIVVKGTPAALTGIREWVQTLDVSADAIRKGSATVDLAAFAFDTSLPLERLLPQQSKETRFRLIPDDQLAQFLGDLTADGQSKATRIGSWQVTTATGVPVVLAALPREGKSMHYQFALKAMTPTNGQQWQTCALLLQAMRRAPSPGRRSRPDLLALPPLVLMPKQHLAMVLFSATAEQEGLLIVIGCG